MSDEEDWEPVTIFIGCTCDHDEEQHGWGSCDQPDCPCEGGWEE